jgi:hypothetical protein
MLNVEWLKVIGESASGTVKALKRGESSFGAVKVAAQR